MDNPYNGGEFENPGEHCSVKGWYGTTICPRYRAVFVITVAKPLTIGFTRVRTDEFRGTRIDRILKKVVDFPIPLNGFS